MAWQLLPIDKPIDAIRVLLLILKCLPFCNDVVLVALVVLGIPYLESVGCLKVVLVVVVWLNILLHLYDVLVVDRANYLVSFIFL